MSKSPRVRFAPSPTGYLHVGGARTALYDYLFAKKNNGQFVLRIEDTDQERSTEEAMKLQIEDLKWLGLDWDEGPDAETLQDKGEYGPYRQSQRLDIYKTHVDKLLKVGKAFYCFMTEEEQEELKQKALSEGKPGQVLSPCRDMTLEEAQKHIDGGEIPVIRFKRPDHKPSYKINDLVRGEVEFPTDMVGDFVIMRSDGMPVYNFCCVIDDALMKISHVFRAEEHLSNTLRQLMLYEAFDFAIPEFAHASIILGEDKQKLSKRHGATSVGQYREMGYLPEAMNNFLALLGWSPSDGEEIQSMDSLKAQFSTDRMNSSPAVFDNTKFKWFNATHLRALQNHEIWQLIQPRLQKAGLKLPDSQEWINNSLELFKSYMETLEDAVALYSPLSETGFEIAEDAADLLTWEQTPKVVSKWKELVEGFAGETISEEDFGNLQNEVKKQCEVKGKFLFMPIRTAVIGKPHGAELKILVPLMTKEELIKRADLLLAKISN